MLSSSDLGKILSKTPVQVGGYWCSAQNQLKFHNQKILSQNKQDYQNFLEWFHTIDGDNGEH